MLFPHTLPNVLFSTFGVWKYNFPTFKEFWKPSLIILLLETAHYKSTPWSVGQGLYTPDKIIKHSKSFENPGKKNKNKRKKILQHK